MSTNASASMADLLHFYEAVATEFSLTIDNDGFMSHVNRMDPNEDNVTPAIIGGKRLIFPTKEALNNADWEQVVGFHPAQETVMGGESKVITYMRKKIAAEFNYSMILYITRAITMAANTAEHKKYNPKQAEILLTLKDADSKMLERTMALFQKVNVAQVGKSLINIYLKKGAIIDGEKCSRGAMISFPFYKQLIDEENPFEVNITKKHRAALIALFEYMFPGIKENEQYYSRAGKSMVAPYFDALLNGVASIGERMNTLWKNILSKGNEKYKEVEIVIPDTTFFDDTRALNKALALMPKFPNGSNDDIIPDTTGKTKEFIEDLEKGDEKDRKTSRSDSEEVEIRSKDSNVLEPAKSFLVPPPPPVARSTFSEVQSRNVRFTREAPPLPPFPKRPLDVPIAPTEPFQPGRNLQFSRRNDRNNLPPRIADTRGRSNFSRRPIGGGRSILD